MIRRHRRELSPRPTSPIALPSLAVPWLGALFILVTLFLPKGVVGLWAAIPLPQSHREEGDAA